MRFKDRASVVTAGGHCPVLVEYFDRLDGSRPQTVLELLAPNFRFATIWGEHDVARPSSGGIAELEAYFATRDATGQRHHVLHGASYQDSVEIAAGYTTRDGTPLASFLTWVSLDASGRIQRLMSARTTALSMLE
jgi:hypothetical protein